VREGGDPSPRERERERGGDFKESPPLSLDL